MCCTRRKRRAPPCAFAPGPSLPRAPRNYRCELPGDCPGEVKRRLLTRYKGFMCLQPITEPGDFTAKFSEAVVAGGITREQGALSCRGTSLQGAMGVLMGVSGGADGEIVDGQGGGHVVRN